MTQIGLKPTSVKRNQESLPSSLGGLQLLSMIKYFISCTEVDSMQLEELSMYSKSMCN